MQVPMRLITALSPILAAIALPNYIKVKDKAKEAEVKANLHNIQLSVERWAVDSEGPYPNYLIGGEPKYAATVIESASAGAVTRLVTPFIPSSASNPTAPTSQGIGWRARMGASMAIANTNAVAALPPMRESSSARKSVARSEP